MNFLNPDDQTRIKIKKPAPASAAPAAAPAPASAAGAPKPGVPGAKPAVPGAKPGVPGAKPGAAPAPGAKPATNVVAVVKQKAPPKVEVIETAPGVFEVHFSCSCGEQYLIRCESAGKEEKPAA